jgi:pilus assembly protein Flp/PilA
MQKIIALKVKALAKAKAGVTAIEYGLIAAFVALAIVGGMQAFGTSLGTFFTNLSTSVSGLKTTAN